MVSDILFPTMFMSSNKNYSFSESEPLIVKSSNQYLTIETLKKFTNYSVWVLSYTKVGDGAKTKHFFCQTHEDVPSAPQDLKAIPASSTKVIVSWLPPINRNGEIVKHHLYYMS